MPWRAVLTVAALSAAGTARAQEPVVYSQVSVVSDYRYDGLSNSDSHPTAQGYAHLALPDGLFAGAFVTGFDLGPTPGPSWEMDVYAGHTFQLRGGEVTLQGMAGLYPDAPKDGPEFNFVQASLKARRTTGPLTLGGQVAFTPKSPYSRRQSWRLAAEAACAVKPWLTLNGALGKRLNDGGQDRAYWDLGATLRRKQLALDIRYVDTDLSRRECFYTDWCGATVVAKLSYSLPPLALR